MSTRNLFLILAGLLLVPSAFAEMDMNQAVMGQVHRDHDSDRASGRFAVGQAKIQASKGDSAVALKAAPSASRSIASDSSKIAAVKKAKTVQKAKAAVVKAPPPPPPKKH